MAQLCRLLATFSYLACTFVQARDANYEAIVAQPPPSSPSQRIPKVVHFIFVDLKPLTWIEHAAVSSAWKIVGAETINLWVPSEPDFPGEMWARVLKIPPVTVRSVEMPDSVFGREIRRIEHVADVVRLRVLHEEGVMESKAIHISQPDWTKFPDGPASRSTALTIVQGYIWTSIWSRYDRRTRFFRTHRQRQPSWRRKGALASVTP